MRTRTGYQSVGHRPKQQNHARTQATWNSTSSKLELVVAKHTGPRKGLDKQTHDNPIDVNHTNSQRGHVLEIPRCPTTSAPVTSKLPSKSPGFEHSKNPGFEHPAGFRYFRIHFLAGVRSDAESRLSSLHGSLSPFLAVSWCFFLFYLYSALPVSISYPILGKGSKDSFALHYYPFTSASLSE